MTKSAAILTVHEADKMTKKGRKDIAKWLTNQAAFLIEGGHVYNKKFTARYLYKE